MIMRTISGSDIDQALTLAMQATLQALVDEGMVDEKQAVEFADSHICMPVNEDGIWLRVRSWIGLEKKEGVSYPVIFKVATKRVA